MKIGFACLALVAVAEAGRRKEEKRKQSHNSYKIALWGDLPYRGSTLDVFENGNEDDYGDIYADLRDTMNSHGVAFNIHSGDVKGGSATCGELSYKRFENLINSFDSPGFLTLGDNEWTDCHRTSNGNYDPLERLAYIRRRFFRGPRTIFGNQKAGSIRTKMQTSEYPEHQMWSYKNVLYVNVHVTGTNNAFDDGKDATCTESHSAIDRGCKKANAEYRARSKAAILYMKDAFSAASKYGMSGIMVSIQANIFRCDNGKDDNTCVDSSTPVLIPSGFQDFWGALVHEAKKFKKPVILFHGDSHVFRVYENPGNEAANIIAVQNPGSGDIGWVLCEVDPDSRKVFNFTHIDNTPDE